MKVYVELVLADNFALTFLLARLTYYLLGEMPSKVRMFFGSLFGAVCAVFYPLIENNFLLLAAKLCVYAGISAILFRPRRLLKGMIFFLLLTFTYGGALFALGYLTYGSLIDALTKPFVSFPIGVGLLTAYVMFATVKVLARKLKKSRDVREFLYDAELRMFDKTVKCRAFLDSGNRLYDDSSGLPVVIVAMSTLQKTLTDSQVTQLLLGNTKTIKGSHYIEFGTVSGKSKLLVFRPDELVVYIGDKKNIISDVMLGVAFKRITDAESYGLILNPAVMTGV